MLKGFSQYEEIRTEFGIILPSTHTTTHTTTVVGAPAIGMHVSMSGAPVPVSVSVPAPTPIVTTTTSISSLDARVTALEQANSLLRSEFDAFKASQDLQNQTFNNLLAALQGASTSVASVTPTPAFAAPTPVQPTSHAFQFGQQ